MESQECRLKILRKIIQERKPSNQSEVASILQKHHGIRVTQAMVSRDLKKLGVITKLSEEKKVYAIPESDVEKEILHRAIQDIRHNETTIVILTLGGLADFVGDMVDASNIDILGCVSGENTVLVIPRSIEQIQSIHQSLCNHLGFEYEETDYCH